MMTCDSFRARFATESDHPAVLEHLRSCDRCLDVAAHLDPDVMFRALGGAEMVPPGGIDEFVGGVMQQVRVRAAETTVASSRGVAWPRRVAMAAAIAAAVFGATLIYRPDAPAVSPATIARAAVGTRPVTPLTTKPVVETYQSENATIVEMPAEGGDDVKIVMVFDENLPVDL